MRIETFVRVRVIDLSPHFFILIFQQNQSKVYREVLIAGDLSQDDLTWVDTQVVLQVSQP